MTNDTQLCGACGHVSPSAAENCTNCGAALAESPAEPSASPLREIVQPFIDLVRAPRALWGVNVTYFIEGLVYFGILNYLAIYFSDQVFAGVPEPDVHSHHMVAVLTAGITISMFFLGFVPDRWGVRQALILSFVLLLIGRVLVAAAPAMGLKPAGLWSELHVVTLAGILIVVIGYGMYQPAAYAAVRQFTTPKTAAMGFAMLYALMNLGGWLPSFFGFIRQSVGIIGAFWVYAALTAVSLILTVVILTRKTVKDAIAAAEAQRRRQAEEQGAAPAAEEAATSSRGVVDGIVDWLRHHPFTDLKFTYFIFCLIPVQTLFAYNWLILPQYVARAYRGTLIGDYYEFAVNLNPLLIFILVPIVTASTQRRNVYSMMVSGTFVMAAPAFLLALGPSVWTLFSYILIMTVGEAMWQPRFLQYAAEIAPPGRTGVYMGVAQFPWFLTKLIVPLYSGYFLTWFCPADGPQRTEIMWLIFAGIAMCSTILLLLARGWIGRSIAERA